ncbi:MAG: hypothetical protein QOF09_1025, partial [Alphaproteobacteria bacterium]|nr:hypothetical protein [Alphaproteobacteria bacterium]
MPGLVPGILAFFAAKQGVDGRDKPGHNDLQFHARRKSSKLTPMNFDFTDEQKLFADSVRR